MGSDEDELYRALIDRLVEDSLTGQGQIAAGRAREGIWNPAASDTFLPEQHRVNALLSELSGDQRGAVAGLLADAYAAGVFGVLVALNDNAVPPFDRSYEGTPFNDFAGRRDGWDWPLEREREK